MTWLNTLKKMLSSVKTNSILTTKSSLLDMMLSFSMLYLDFITIVNTGRLAEAVIFLHSPGIMDYGMVGIRFCADIHVPQKMNPNDC